jgi:hypothetical protein
MEDNKENKDNNGNTEMTECSICFEEITNISTANCNHDFCHSCIMDWCNLGAVNCPLCRTRMFELKQKTDTDNVVPENKKNKVLIIDLDSNEKIPRVILMRLEGDKTPGVLVDYIDEDSIFINILKEGDRLLYVNGLPCVNSHDAVAVINHTYGHRGILKIEILEDGWTINRKVNKKRLTQSCQKNCFVWVYNILH